MIQQSITAIPAEIILGKPSEGCQGHGICRVLTQSVAKSMKCPTVPAVIQLDQDNNLRFCFPKSGLTDQMKTQHFSSPWFKVEETFLLPGRLKAQMNLQRVQILPGNYLITEREHDYIVTL